MGKIFELKLFFYVSKRGFKILLNRKMLLAKRRLVVFEKSRK